MCNTYYISKKTSINGQNWPYISIVDSWFYVKRCCSKRWAFWIFQYFQFRTLPANAIFENFYQKSLLQVNAKFSSTLIPKISLKILKAFWTTAIYASYGYFFFIFRVFLGHELDIYAYYIKL